MKNKVLKKSKFFIEKMKNKKYGFLEKNNFVHSGIAHWNPCYPLSSNMPDPFSCHFSFDHSDSKKSSPHSISVDLARGSHGNLAKHSFSYRKPVIINVNENLHAIHSDA